MNTAFGKFVRNRREELARKEGGYSVRKLAAMLDIQPSYISKIERCEVPPPSEDTIKDLAKMLRVDADELLALAGKVSAELLEVIIRRPRLFADLLRQLKDAPDHVVLQLKQVVQDGMGKTGREDEGG